MGTIEAVKTVADMFAPVSGVIEEANTSLNDEPSLVGESPFDKGWFVKMKLSDRAELDKLMKKSEYDKMVGKD
jgi:glycine cleavage system H protein